ncbi:hypothetical protein ACIA5C_47900 [Actinoplanes sp. NPDC051343]|uniref:hypothetical protein n=1 Tax=Actinoplanes sp. NPDC051343 TaxID=3363906 RepID=UPI0037B7CA4E
MPDVRTVTVCMPATAVTDQIPAAVSALLAAHGITDAGLVGHFRAKPRHLLDRLRRADTIGLLYAVGGAAAGGPLRLLDLDAMRDDLARRYWNRWQLWQQIVAGSPEPKPWWQFYDRHAADPDNYTWEHARHGFASQPRVARMLTYNAHPGRLTELPTDHLDAFNAGRHAYAMYGGLRAVPAAAMLTADGRLLRPVSLRYADELDYLRLANEHLTALAGTDVVVAVTTK